MRKWLKHVTRRLGIKTRDQKGFTLIELAVALAILGILIAIAVPTYLSVRKRSYDSEAKQTLGEIRSVTWSYYLEHDKWPADLTALGYEVGDAATRWNITLDGTGTNAVITADGISGQPTDGRCWQMTLTREGNATLTECAGQ